MSNLEGKADDAQDLIGWARSNQSSSIVAGLACALVAALLYTGAGQTVAWSAGAAVLLLLVPVANAIT